MGLFWGACLKRHFQVLLAEIVIQSVGGMVWNLQAPARFSCKGLEPACAF